MSKFQNKKAKRIKVGKKGIKKTDLGLHLINKNYRKRENEIIF